MSKRIGQTLGMESHTFVLGKSQTTSIKSWQALNMNSPFPFISEFLKKKLPFTLKD
jgi:hypothetical protein